MALGGWIARRFGLIERRWRPRHRHRHKDDLAAYAMMSPIHVIYSGVRVSRADRAAISNRQQSACYRDALTPVATRSCLNVLRDGHHQPWHSTKD